MVTLVVDASVALKWFVFEVHQGHAVNVLESRQLLLAPHHFRLELASALRKKVRAGDVLVENLEGQLADIIEVPVREVPSVNLLTGAMSIALRFNRSIYDSLYVALALQERCRLVTADRRLYDAVASAYPETMLWIEDVSPDPG